MEAGTRPRGPLMIDPLIRILVSSGFTVVQLSSRGLKAPLYVIPSQKARTWQWGNSV